jgi:hypothetical protein
VVKCLIDPNGLAKMRRGALTIAQNFSVENHLNKLLRVFEGILRQPSLRSDEAGSLPVGKPAQEILDRQSA